MLAFGGGRSRKLASEVLESPSRATQGAYWRECVKFDYRNLAYTGFSFVFIIYLVTPIRHQLIPGYLLKLLKLPNFFA